MFCKPGLTSLTVVAASALCAANASAATQTTAAVTQVFDRPVSSSLSLGVQFFTLRQEDDKTSLPVKSIVADETSVTVGTVTIATPADRAQPPAPAVTPLANDTASTPTATTSDVVVAGMQGALPVKVDRSSTAAQEQQLARFERQNKIGEAFLLAGELLKQNPGAEFAYDAAIRTSLVLRLQQDVERFYLEAIRQSEYPGKYYVQLAHFYVRTGQAPALQKLIADYTAQSKAAPDYQLTLTRLYSVAGDSANAATSGLTGPPTLTTVLLALRSASTLGDQAKLSTLLEKVQQLDVTAREARILLLHLLGTNAARPETISPLVQRALSNEVDYARATELCDSVFDRLSETHSMPDLKRHVDRATTEGKLNDVQSFFAARLYERLLDTSAALATVRNPTAGRTPLLAVERARLMSTNGSTSDAVSILTDLVQEQPTDEFLRLELVRALAAAGDAAGVLQHLGAIPFSGVATADRAEYLSLQTTATLRQRDAARTTEFWLEVAPQLTFTELMQVGDLVVQFAGEGEREAITSTASDRVVAPAAWRLSALLARLSAARGDHQTELSYYEDYLRHDPENVPMLRFVAELAMQNSSVPLELQLSANDAPVQLHASSSSGTDLAIQLLQKLIELQPRVSDNYAALMRAYQMRGEVEAAKKVAMELADRDSSSPQSCVAAGRILEENGLHQDSLVFYRAAVKQDPENFNGWMQYAGALRKVGKLAEAQAIYRRILEEGLHGVPFNQPTLIASLLAIATDTKSIPELISYIDSLRLRNLPGKAEFYVTAAKLLMQLEQTPRAEAYLQEFATTLPNAKLQSEGQLLLGHLQYTRKDYEAARVTFAAVADTYTSAPAGITAAFNVGEILRQMGRTKEAVDAWEQLATRHTTEDKALQALHEAALAAYVEMRDITRAIGLMERFLASGTQDAALLKKGRESLVRMRAGAPIPDYNAAT